MSYELEKLRKGSEYQEHQQLLDYLLELLQETELDVEAIKKAVVESRIRKIDSEIVEVAKKVINEGPSDDNLSKIAELRTAKQGVDSVESKDQSEFRRIAGQLAHALREFFDFGARKSKEAEALRQPSQLPLETAQEDVGQEPEESDAISDEEVGNLSYKVLAGFLDGDEVQPITKVDIFNLLHIPQSRRTDRLYSEITTALKSLISHDTDYTYDIGTEAGVLQMLKDIANFETNFNNLLGAHYSTTEGTPNMDSVVKLRQIFRALHDNQWISRDSLRPEAEQIVREYFGEHALPLTVAHTLESNVELDEYGYPADMPYQHEDEKIELAVRAALTQIDSLARQKNVIVNTGKTDYASQEIVNLFGNLHASRLDEIFKKKLGIVAVKQNKHQQQILDQPNFVALVVLNHYMRDSRTGGRNSRTIQPVINKIKMLVPQLVDVYWPKYS